MAEKKPLKEIRDPIPIPKIPPKEDPKRHDKPKNQATSLNKIKSSYLFSERTS